MTLETIRPYEMSLWTLQDSFITILKPIGVSFKGQIIEPNVSLKNDGTQNLTFSIPMYYRNNIGELVENPLWYHTQNGNLLVNLRKIKVIFNKGEKGEEVYEFVIQKITESHSGGQLICDIEAEGLAFQELGKSGYKITLNYDEFLIDLERKEENGEELISSLNYWASKLFEGTNWSYSIQMDWSSFDGIIDIKDGKIINYEDLIESERDKLNETREKQGLRRRDKIYEEEYISSWSVDEESQTIIPSALIDFKEKARIPQIEKSNRYNASQDLAELFEVYCKYKYIYDNNYHIVGRECIFYNNFLDESNGKFDINYPYHTNEIKRTLESADVVTKMYVVPTNDISIVNVSANKSKEDYILNFDYLYNIGTITQEQYDSIETYQYNMHSLNNNYEILSVQKNKFDNETVDLRAEYTSILNSISYANEQITEAEKIISSIKKGEEYLHKTIYSPERIMITEESIEGEKIYKTKFTLDGIKKDSAAIYLEYNAGEVVESSKIDLTKASSLVEKENLIGYTNLPVEKTGSAFLVCDYNPTLKYETIIEEYTIKLNKDKKRKGEIEERMSIIGFTYKEGNFEMDEVEVNEGETLNYYTISEKLKKLQEELQNARTDFERMMGPALREGSWQPEKDYADDGDRFTEILTFGETSNTGKITSTFWDDILFDEEKTNYYEEGVNLDKIYYPLIDITEIYPILYNAINEENSTIKEEDLVIYFEMSKGDNENFEYYLNIFSSFDYIFVKDINKNIIPTFIIFEEFTDEELEALKGAKIGIQKIKEDGSIEFNPIVENLNFITNVSSYKTVYPRIKFNSDKLKTTDNELSVYKGENKLEKYSDYTLLSRNEYYCLTIKPRSFLGVELFIEEGEEGQKKIKVDLNLASFILHYALSNAELMMYLDALEVSKINAYPQASYEVSVKSLSKEFIKYIYKKLNKVANINDHELKFENVQGYISEINIKLDKPDQDSIIIQNYKTKFEDLFSRIVASTEQMKSNQLAYDRAASSFTSGGYLSKTVIQQSINQGDLKYSFNKGKLSIDENNGIWAISEDGAVAMRGGGIFCATEKDVNNNWLWNTGITPSGINASLLRAGTIDTNLIRIYSGDNVRFQMNADGLFAYAELKDGETNFDKYVVHNNEGLFLTEKNNDEKIDLVEISWDGLILRNKQGDIVFNADRGTGNLTISGEVKANTGSIGGWKITNGGLEWSEKITDVDGTIENREAGLVAVNPNSDPNSPYAMIYARGKDGSFEVHSDGTLYAKNAYFQGEVAAGSYIANMPTEAAVDAIRRLEFVNFYGTSFNYSNPNLDGDIILERNWLKFACRQVGINCEAWKIYRVIQEKNEQENKEEILELYYNSKDGEVLEDYKKVLQVAIVNDLTFSLESAILEIDKTTEIEESALFKIIGVAKEFNYDEQGRVNPNDQKQVEHECYFTIYNSKKDLTKRISLFNPPSYSFTNLTLYEQSQEDLRIDKINKFNKDGETLEEKFGKDYFIDNLYKDDDASVNFKDFLESVELEEELLNLVTTNTDKLLIIADQIIDSLNESITLKNSKDFILNLTNIDLRAEGVIAEEKTRTGEAILDGNSNLEKTAISDSTILVPEDFLSNGILEINGRPIEDGNPITGEEYNIDVFYEVISETESKLIFRINRNDIPEGEELYLRYSYEKAFRTCNVFRPKNGRNSINTVIKSSEGNVFKNGEVETELSVEVYDGVTLLNGPEVETHYGYLWFKDGEPVEAFINRKDGIQITAEDVGSKVVYAVQVYNTEQEANDEYHRITSKNET